MQRTCPRSACTRRCTSAGVSPHRAMSAALLLNDKPSVFSATPTNSRGESNIATLFFNAGCIRSDQSVRGEPRLQSWPNMLSTGDLPRQEAIYLQPMIASMELPTWAVCPYGTQ